MPASFAGTALRRIARPPGVSPMDSINVRNLEQIQESDTERRSVRLLTLVLASIGGAALVVTSVVALKRAEPATQSTADPLAELVAKAKRTEATPAEQVDPSKVTFPAILSDGESPTTALAAVKDERGRLVDQASATSPLPPLEAQSAAGPEAANELTDRLPRVPLPAGSLLHATRVTSDPKDALSQLARDKSELDETAELSAAGSEGGFQIQVASYKDQTDADRFVDELRRRGHRAYRQAAYVHEKGLWHRVRIGPFKSKLSAASYQREFEQKERLSTFLVDPDKVKRQRDLRAAKLAELSEGDTRP